MKNTKYIIIFLALGFSFILTRFLGNELFIASTPRINNNFLTKVKNLPSIFISYVSFGYNSPSSSSGSFPQFSQIKQIYEAKPFVSINRGVYAYEEGGINYVKFKNSEINYKTIEITTKNGKVIRLSYPDNSPPEKKILEEINSTN